MLIYGVSKREIEKVVIPGVRIYDIEAKNQQGTAWRVKLKADGIKYGRLGRSRRKDGRLRRAPGCLCWHGFRDFMLELFEKHPEARVKTALADYRGAEDFQQKYRETGYENIGSRMEPLELQDACECEGNENLPAWETGQRTMEMGGRE